MQAILGFHHRRGMLMNVQLHSLIKKTGELEISLQEIPLGEPKADEVVVRMEASPINPSDLGLLFGLADMSTAVQSGTKDRPVVTAKVPEKMMRGMAARVDKSMPVGNEGSGIVVKAGTSKEAQALLGKTVAMWGGAMYARFRTIQAAQCLVLPEGTKPSEGASCFINPLTALCMVEAMRRENHKALVHTVGASNLGLMLLRICLQDGIDLINIVRKPEHEAMLRKLGAKYVCNSSLPTFLDDLTKALAETGATLAFDAIGGGKLASQILSCMEAVAASKMTEYNRYGSSTFKQIYIYGMLDRGPTELLRNIGFAWSVGGFLVTPFLDKIGAAAAQKMRERVVAELKTTFASHYTKEVSLAEALQLDAINAYGKLGTGEKFLVNPSK